MGHFHAEGKRYAGGEHLDGIAVNDLDIALGGTVLTQMASATVVDGSQELKFLFWDTGRRITNKRKVRWTFHHPENWSDWNATAWYGFPSTGPGGVPAISAHSFRVGTGALPLTPIASPASTFVNGPGGTPIAFPYAGDNHVGLTQYGPAHVVAKSTYPAGVITLNFSGWTRLIYGGDTSGYFEENDDDITSGSGVTGIENSTEPTLDFSTGQSAELLASYVVASNSGIGPIKKWLDFLRGMKVGGFDMPDRGDPSPEDIIRLKLIAESLDMVRGEKVSEIDAYEGLISAAKKMNSAELKRSISGTKANLLRGQAALKSLEALAKKVRK